MRRFVDLHTHSTASDGSCEPAEVIRLAEGRRLAAVALTDHDTTEGLAPAREAARDLPSLKFLGGVEVSARFPRGTLHILGLGIDERSAELKALMEQLLTARNERNPRMIAALQALGVDIDMDDVLAAAAGGVARPKTVVGRLHMAEALRRKKAVSSIDEAFARYLGPGGAAYVDKERLSPRSAIGAIRAAGGVAVLAHPTQLLYENRSQIERILRQLLHDGLNGIEVYHTDHSDQQTRLYLDLAGRHGLCVCGGSDFHGTAKSKVALGLPRVPLAAISGALRQMLA